MKGKSRENVVAIATLIGSLPLSGSIALFLAMTSARKAGHPYSGDALGLMMLSMLAYAIAVIPCAIGIAYFGFLMFRKGLSPSWWQWLIVVFSFGQIIAAVIYLNT